MLMITIIIIIMIIIIIIITIIVYNYFPSKNLYYAQNLVLTP